jgi:hypothetical protein
MCENVWWLCCGVVGMVCGSVVRRLPGRLRGHDVAPARSREERRGGSEVVLRWF